MKQDNLQHHHRHRLLSRQHLRQQRLNNQLDKVLNIESKHRFDKLPTHQLLCYILVDHLLENWGDQR
jgi:hypothetical protein